MDRLFETQSLGFLTKAMDCTSMAHSVIANNIANLNTTGFKGTHVAFKDRLQMVLNGEGGEMPMKASDARHFKMGMPLTLADVQPQMVTDPNTSMRADGNNLDIDQENAMLAENSQNYNMLTRLTSDQLRRIRMAIEGR